MEGMPSEPSCTGRNIAERLLCRQRRRYIPADIFKGQLSQELVNKSRRTGDVKWAKMFRMVAENPTWGAPRIYGELKMLDLDISERTVLRWMRKGSRRPELAMR